MQPTTCDSFFLCVTQQASEGADRLTAAGRSRSEESANANTALCVTMLTRFQPSVLHEVEEEDPLVKGVP